MSISCENDWLLPHSCSLAPILPASIQPAPIYLLPFSPLPFICSHLYWSHLACSHLPLLICLLPFTCSHLPAPVYLFPLPAPVYLFLCSNKPLCQNPKGVNKILGLSISTATLHPKNKLFNPAYLLYRSKYCYYCRRSHHMSSFFDWNPHLTIRSHHSSSIFNQKSSSCDEVMPQQVHFQCTVSFSSKICTSHTI